MSRRARVRDPTTAKAPYYLNTVSTESGTLYEVPASMAASSQSTEERGVPSRPAAAAPANESIVVSLDRNTSESSVCGGDDICCLHGLRCAVGEAEDKPAEYETVEFSRLESPPPESASLTAMTTATTRNSINNNNNNNNNNNKNCPRKSPADAPVLIRCRRPNDVSSFSRIRTSSGSSASNGNVDDGRYENIDVLPKSSRCEPIMTKMESDTSISSRASTRHTAGPTLKDFYLGAMTKREAEKCVKRRTYFRLYHRISSRAMKDPAFIKDAVTLYIVYRTSHGLYCHYPVKRVRSDNSAGGRSSTHYFVACEDKYPARFNSLDSLVRFYSVYVQLGLVGDGDVEVFPVPRNKLQHKSLRRAVAVE